MRAARVLASLCYGGDKPSDISPARWQAMLAQAKGAVEAQQQDQETDADGRQ